MTVAAGPKGQKSRLLRLQDIGNVFDFGSGKGRFVASCSHRRGPS